MTEVLNRNRTQTTATLGLLHTIFIQIYIFDTIFELLVTFFSVGLKLLSNTLDKTTKYWKMWSPTVETVKARVKPNKLWLLAQTKAVFNWFTDARTNNTDENKSEWYFQGQTDRFRCLDDAAYQMFDSDRGTVKRCTQVQLHSVDTFRNPEEQYFNELGGSVAILELEHLAYTNIWVNQ